MKKQRGANAVAVAKRVKEELEKIRATLPRDIDLVVRVDGTAHIEESTREIEFALLLAVFLTGLVCWTFLGSFSAALNVLLAIPKSIIGVFAALYFLGFTLNTFTLLALSLAVVLSLLEALTLTPMRASQLKGHAGHDTRIGRAMERVFKRLARAYKGALAISLRRPGIVLLVCTAIFAASLSLVGRLGKKFVPPQDQGRILVRLQTPVGSSVDHTDSVVRRCEAALAERPEVAGTFVVIGGFGGGEVNTAVLFVNLVPREERSLSQQQFMALLRRKLGSIPDAKVVLQNLSLAGFTAQRGFPIEFSIRGPSFEMLARKQAEVAGRMEASGKFVDVDTDYLVGMPEVRLEPDRDRAPTS